MRSAFGQWSAFGGPRRTLGGEVNMDWLAPAIEASAALTNTVVNAALTAKRPTNRSSAGPRRAPPEVYATTPDASIYVDAQAGSAGIPWLPIMAVGGGLVLMLLLRRPAAPVYLPAPPRANPRRRKGRRHGRR